MPDNSNIARWPFDFPGKRAAPLRYLSAAIP
jgi:hypothetical protein